MKNTRYKFKALLMVLVVFFLTSETGFSQFANAGTDIETCESIVTLDANMPEDGESGVWTVISGSIEFENRSMANTTVYLFEYGIYKLAWTITTADQTTTTDEIIIDYNMPSEAKMKMNSGSVGCKSNSPIIAYDITKGNGLWSVVKGNSVISNTTRATTTVSNLSSGENILKWTVTHGTCQSTATVQLVSELPHLAVENDNVVVCEGGSATLSATGNGTNYVWSNEFGLTTLLSNPNKATTSINYYNGQYNSALFRVSVANENCPLAPVTKSVSVMFKPAPTANAGADKTYCEGVDGLLLNGTGGKTYSWTPVEGLNDATKANPVAQITETTTYTLTVTDTNGCSATDDITLNYISGGNIPVANAGADQTICLGETTRLNASGGDNYQWTPAANLSDATIANPDAKPLKTTEYVVTVTNSSGCSDTDIVTITVDHPIVSIEKQDVTQAGGFDGSISIVYDGVYSFNWSNGETTPTIDNLAAGLYVVKIQNENGCKLKKQIRIKEPNVIDCDLQPDFEYEVTGKSVTLNAVPDGSLHQLWTLGNGSYAAGAQTTFEYQREGVYDVCMISYKSPGCIARECKKIEIGDVDCTADIGYFYPPNDPKTVHFVANTSGNIKSVYWDFGDGNTSEEIKPIHTYPKESKYEVQLRVKSTISKCIASDIKVVNIGRNNLNAKFLFFIDANTPQNRNVSFLNLSTGNYTHSFWDFGDGSTSIQKNPVHEYTKAGKYEVKLVVRNPETGKMSAQKHKLMIGAVGMMAKFDHTIDTETNTVEFKNISSGTAQFYFWNFGDGTFSLEENPVKTYSKPGVYKIRFVVASAGRLLYDEVTEKIQVGDAECSAHFIPHVDINTNVVKFKSTGVGQNLTHEWSFGDAKTSDIPNPSHSYETAGYYNVHLTVKTSNGSCTDSYTEILLVGNQVNDIEACYFHELNDKEVLFHNKPADNTRYIWNFGDGTVREDAAKVVSHTYTEYGLYNVCLTAFKATGVKDISCSKVKVVPENEAGNYVEADFTHTIDRQTKTVSFTDASKGTPNKWDWSFKDNGESTEQNPVVTFTAAGYYKVKLKVRNTTSGSKSKAVKLINVGAEEKMAAAIDIEKLTSNNKYGGYPVEMVGAAFGDPAKVVWDFGDGSPLDSTSTTVVHEYEEPGTYTVCFTVTDPVSGEETKTCTEVNVTSSIDEHVQQLYESIYTYPNPAKGISEIGFELKNSSNVNIELLDITGRQIQRIKNGFYTSGKHNVYFDTQSLSAGMYLLHIKAGDYLVNKKLIIE